MRLRDAGNDPRFTACAVPTEVVPWRGGAVRGAVHDENAWALGGHGLCGHAGLFGAIYDVLALGAAVLDVLAERRQEFRREVQPRRRGRDGARCPGVQGLVALAVERRRTARPPDVGRQWNAAHALEPRQNALPGVDAEPPPPVAERSRPVAKLRFSVAAMLSPQGSFAAYSHLFELMAERT